MGLYYDFHIHSCLSACADDDMTPHNICAMARLKGLHAIAVTDHNSAGNLRAVASCASQQGLLLLPGMELCSREEVHLLAYFPSLDEAEAMAAWCRPYLPDINNRPDYFGRQLYMDDQDQIIGQEERLLIMALDVGLSALVMQVRAQGGVPVPAHVNRGSNGLLTALGFVPEEEAFTSLEICADLPLPPAARAYRQLQSSDAHSLGDIAEPGPAMAGLRTPADICRWLASPREE